MTEATARFALPLLSAGQAQKELFHNEALTLVDALLEPVVKAIAQNDPPSAPQIGQSWIVGAAPTGAWSGRAQSLAVWSDGGWRFADARAGMAVWSLADSVTARFDGAAWRLGDVEGSRLLLGGRQVVGTQRPAIGDPTGGTTIDIEARSAIIVLLQALRGHGLIAI